MSADGHRLLHKAQRLMAMSAAMQQAMEALRRQLEQRMDTSQCRVDRTRDLLTLSATLLQHAQTHRAQSPEPVVTPQAFISSRP